MSSTRMRWWIALTLGCALAAGAGFGALARAADEEGSSTRTTHRTTKATTAATSTAPKTDSLALERKLDDVLAGQQAILKRLDEVMEELKIVKIRASVR